MSDEAVQKLQAGSKLVIVGWFAYCTIVWSLKATVLFYYNRLTYARVASIQSFYYYLIITPGPGYFTGRSFADAHFSVV